MAWFSLSHSCSTIRVKTIPILAPASRRECAAGTEGNTKNNRAAEARLRVIREIDDAEAAGGFDSVPEGFVHRRAGGFPDFDEHGQHITIGRSRLPQARQDLGKICLPLGVAPRCVLHGRRKRRRDVHRQSLQCRGEH